MNTLNLKAYLANVGMTMTDFCHKIDCDRAYLSCISSGKIMPGRRLAKEIFTATNGVINLPVKPKKQHEDKKKQQQQNIDG